MFGSFRTGRRLASTLLLAVCLSPACQKETASDGQPGSAAPKPKDLPPLKVKADTPNLLLTWIDDQGDFHVVLKPADVPTAARKTVRVVVTDQPAGTTEHVYVADLNETAPDGTYRVTTMSRAAWDELGASRRKARLEALAPPAPSAAPPGAPNTVAPAGSAKLPIGSITAIVYGADWCKPCHDAERYLRHLGVNVIKKDIEQSEVAASEMKRKLERAGMPGASIPVIDVMGRVLVGFSPPALQGAVQAAQSAKPL
jgi:glutaredoxin